MSLLTGPGISPPICGRRGNRDGDKLLCNNPQLPAQLAFLIQVKALNKTVHRTIIDEGASTCLMSMSCWKNLGSPPLSKSSTTLKAFDGRSYTPYGILSNLQVELGGKTVEVDVEVIDGNLNYNILLGRP